jgi:hypothetical protein
MRDDIDDTWVDTTVIGSPYETQLNPSTNQQRYRLRRMPLDNDYDLEIDGAWKSGEPPQTKSNTPL